MRQSGTVKFYNSQKGFGFIKPDDGGKDVFVHVTAVERAGINNLDEGMRISFETEPDKRGNGPKAINLQGSWAARSASAAWPEQARLERALNWFRIAASETWHHSAATIPHFF